MPAKKNGRTAWQSEISEKINAIAENNIADHNKIFEKVSDLKGGQSLMNNEFKNSQKKADGIHTLVKKDILYLQGANQSVKIRVGKVEKFIEKRTWKRELMVSFVKFIGYSGLIGLLGIILQALKIIDISLT